MKSLTKLTPETIQRIWSIYHFVDAIIAMALTTFVGDDPTDFQIELDIRDHAAAILKFLKL